MKPFWLLLWLGLADVAWPATRTTSTGSPSNQVWRAEMPTNIHALFRSVIESTTPDGPFRTGTPFFRSEETATPPPTNQAQWVARNLRTLESLSQTRWPALEGWERIQFQRSRLSTARTNAVSTGWLIARTPRGLLLLESSSANALNTSTNFIGRWEPIRFLNELRTTLAYLGDTNASVTAWPYEHLRFWHSQHAQYLPVLVRLAYEAAWFGHTNEAAGLLRHALRHDTTGEHFERLVLNAAVTAYDEGMQLTVSEAARSEVLAAWEQFVRTFPQSPQHGQITDYVATLRQQVGEFEELKRTTVENPERLPPAERAEYYLARFPELRRPEGSSFYSESDSDLRARVVKLGTAAIPALLNHLTDRRLTRLTNSSFGRPRHVLRVQDLALECFERITKVRFFRHTSGQIFSTDKPAVRESTVREATEWWRAHGDQPLLQGQLAQLEKLPLYERLSTLQRLENEHPGEVKALEFLRKWAGEVPVEQRHLLTEPMARRGDLSQLPALREALLRDAYVSRQDVLLRYGGVKDYDAVRRAQWRSHGSVREELPRHLPGSESLLYQLSDTRLKHPATNFFAVPLLLDSMERFRVALYQGGGRPQATSRTDEAMAHLVRLTGHAGDYRTNAPLGERAGAVSHWLDWWDKTGLTQFIAAHPEAAELFFERPITVDSLVLRDTNQSVSIASANRTAPVSYDLPRGRLPELLRSGAVRGRQFGETEVFRFTTPETEEKWFTQTAPQWLRSGKAGTTSGASPRPTAMRVALSGGAWPDSNARVWALWTSDTPWPAIFDGKRWRAFDEGALPETTRGHLEFKSATAGERGAMFFQDSEGGLLLHDAAGWMRSAKPQTSAAEELLRLRRNAAALPAWSDSPGYRILKDAADNLWTIGQQPGITVGGKDGQKVIIWPEKTGPGLTSADRPWLLPLGKGKVMLAVSKSHRTAATFSALDGPPRKLADVPLPLSTRALLSPVRDRAGLWWLTTVTNSVALDANGKVTAEVAGQFLLEDADKGRWVLTRGGSQPARLRRVAKDKSEAQLAVPGLTGEAALAPDGTVWVLAAPDRLLRVGLRKKALVVLGQWQVRSSHNSQLWCDDTGKVWVRAWESGYSGGVLTCLPAPSRAD